MILAKTANSTKTASAHCNDGYTSLMVESTPDTKIDQPSVDRTTPFKVGEWLVEPATDRLIRGDPPRRNQVEQRIAGLDGVGGENPANTLT